MSLNDSWNGIGIENLAEYEDMSNDQLIEVRASLERDAKVNPENPVTMTQLKGIQDVLKNREIIASKPVVDEKTMFDKIASKYSAGDEVYIGNEAFVITGRLTNKKYAAVDEMGNTAELDEDRIEALEDDYYEDMEVDSDEDEDTQFSMYHEAQLNKVAGEDDNQFTRIPESVLLETYDKMKEKKDEEILSLEEEADFNLIDQEVKRRKVAKRDVDALNKYSTLEHTIDKERGFYDSVEDLCRKVAKSLDIPEDEVNSFYRDKYTY